LGIWRQRILTAAIPKDRSKAAGLTMPRRSFDENVSIAVPQDMPLSATEIWTSFRANPEGTEKMRQTHFALLFLAAFCIGSAAPAAAAVVYTYTGSDFDVFYNSDAGFAYAAGDRLTFNFSLPTALAAGASTDLLLQQTDWNASDGKYTFGGNGQVGLFSLDTYNSQAVTSVLGADLTTDASGNITSWSFSLFSSTHASQAYSSSTPFDVALSGGVYDYIYSRPGDSGANGVPIEEAAVNRPGSWTVTGAASAVPEPATWAMLLLGLFGVGFMMRGARRKDAVALV
jgi:PEP-CTERM motif